MWERFLNLLTSIFEFFFKIACDHCGSQTFFHYVEYFYYQVCNYHSYANGGFCLLDIDYISDAAFLSGFS